MSKKLKGVLLGVGIALGVLVVGAGVAYGFLSATPKLGRKVTVLEQLLPRGSQTYVVASDLGRLGKLYRRSSVGSAARRLGIEEDFNNLGAVARIRERTRGRFFDLLGRRFIYADYGEEGKLLVSESSWNVRMLWRTVLSRGKQHEIEGIPYSVLSDSSAVAFAGSYFWYASSEGLLLRALKVAASETLTEEGAFPRRAENAFLAYGLVRKAGRYLSASQIRWSASEGKYGLEGVVELDEPAGIVGGLLARIREPRDYSRIPADAALFVNLRGADPYKAWKEAEKSALDEGTEKVLSDIDKEKLFATIATDLGDEAFLVFQGWDTDRWYAPARWLLSLKASTDRSIESWKALTPWFFPSASDTALSYRDVFYTYLDFGEDFAPLVWLSVDSQVVLATDTALLYHTLDSRSSGLTIANSKEFASQCEAVGIKNPVAYLSWPRFKEALKPYLNYAADRSSGFTPQDVDSKLAPLLEAVKVKAVIAGISQDGKTLVLTVRFAR